jgi:anti-sigma factor RsiW
MSMNDEELSALIRSHATRYRVSSPLLAKVRTQVALEAAAHTPQATPVPLQPEQGAIRPAPGSSGGTSDGRPGHSSGQGLRHWPSALAGFVAGVALCLALIPFVPFHGSPPAAAGLAHNEALQAELLSLHVHALKSGPLLQVASSDRHTVKPWFQGKLDYAPPVMDLAEAGFPLLGARIDQVQGAAAAALVYGHRLHRLTLYVWPADGVLPASRAHLRGFNVWHWQDGAMQYWLVSDMDDAETARFAQAWQAHRVPL